MDADVLHDLTDAPKEVSIPLRPPEKLLKSVARLAHDEGEQ
jgi:hypothetical protein